ncbi:unnamed protein product [Parajaminaea phylloscopi]
MASSCDETTQHRPRIAGSVRASTTCDGSSGTSSRRSEATIDPSTAVNSPRPSASYSRSAPATKHANTTQFDRPGPAQGDEEFFFGGEPIAERIPTRQEVLEQEALVIVGFQGPDDKLNPRNQSLLTRFLVSMCIGANTFLVSAFASAYLFVAPGIQEEFGVSREHVIAGFVVYVAMWGFGPLVWAPLSATVGRKPVYIFSSAAWTLCNVGCARAPNMSVLIACRFLSGILGSGCLCNGSGSNADMFLGHARTRAIALYMGMVYLGPVVGPLVGGSVTRYAPATPNGGWRWIFYGGIIAGSIITVLHCIIMETNHNVRLRSRVKRLNRDERRTALEHDRTCGESGSAVGKEKQRPRYTTEDDRFGLSLSDKFVGVIAGAARMLFEEPIILFISLWQTTVTAVVYLFFEGFDVVFAEGHGFNSFQTGLCFVGVGIGMSCACVWACTGDLKLWNRRVARHDGRSEPEMRVPQGLAGAVLTVIGLFWFGYTSYPSVHWIVPIIGAAIYGAGAISVVMATMAYVVDTYNTRAAPAFAAVGLIRSIVTSVLPLVGTQFFKNVNPRNTCLILGILALLQIATPLAAMKYGSRLRDRSRFALKTSDTIQR